MKLPAGTLAVMGSWGVWLGVADDMVLRILGCVVVVVGNCVGVMCLNDTGLRGEGGRGDKRLYNATE